MQAKATECWCAEQNRGICPPVIPRTSTTNLRTTDRLLRPLMCLQWLASISYRIWITPLTGLVGQARYTRKFGLRYFWVARFRLLPVILRLTRSGVTSTRYIIAIGQMMMGVLLNLFNLRTHRNAFSHLRLWLLLAFYRDWRVLVPATLESSPSFAARFCSGPIPFYGVTAAKPMAGYRIRRVGNFSRTRFNHVMPVQSKRDEEKADQKADDT